jgi:hypothetical protein
MSHLAILLLPLAGLACWRWSRLVSGALVLAFGAALVYRYAWPWEGLRWVSAATGLAGAVELGRRARLRRLQCHTTTRIGVPVFMWQTYKAGRPDLLAALLVGSAVSDALAYRVFVGRGLWVMAAAQIGWLAAMIAVSLWPTRRVPCSNG